MRRLGAFLIAAMLFGALLLAGCTLGGETFKATTKLSTEYGFEGEELNIIRLNAEVFGPLGSDPDIDRNRTWRIEWGDGSHDEWSGNEHSEKVTGYWFSYGSWASFRAYQEPLYPYGNTRIKISHEYEPGVYELTVFMDQQLSLIHI